MRIKSVQHCTNVSKSTSMNDNSANNNNNHQQQQQQQQQQLYKFSNNNFDVNFDDSCADLSNAPDTCSTTTLTSITASNNNVSESTFRNSARNVYQEVPVSNSGSVTDEDSNSSSRTLESTSHDSAITVGSSGFEESNWKVKKNKNRPLSESYSVDDFNQSVRLRSLSHLHQLKDHRSSADVYLMEDASKSLPRYSTLSPSVSPKHQLPSNTQYGSPCSSCCVPEPVSCYVNSMYPTASVNHMHVPADKSNYGNYQMLQHQYLQPQSQSSGLYQRSNYGNLCRLGCDHCVSGSSYLQSCHHPPLHLYDPHLSALNNSPYWDCGPASLPNPYLLPNNANFHSFFATQPHLSQLGTRKNLNNNNTNNNNNNNNNNNSSGNPTQVNCAENVDKLQQEHPHQQPHRQLNQHQLDKSSNSTPEYLHDSPDLNDTSAEHERDSALLSSSQYVNGNEHQQIFSQTDRIAHLESFVSVLRNQLLNTEDLFKKALISKKTLENTNANLLAVIDKLKLELSHSETHRKLNEEHNISVEGDIGSLKTRLLEKETEISSLRLTMAKIVRSTGYTLSENELALLRGKTIATDFIKNKLIKDIYSEGTPRAAPTKPNAFYSEPSSRRDSFSSALYGRPSSPIVGYQSAHPSPSTTPLVRSNPSNYVSATLPNSSMLRSTSAENMKMNSEHGATSVNHSTPEHQSKENKYQRKFNKNPYSTLPHNSKTMRQIQKQLDETEKHGEGEKNRHQSNNEISELSQPQLVDQPQLQSQQQSNPYLNKKVLSTPSSPLNTFKSPVHEHQMSGVTFAKDDEIIPSSLQSSTSEMQRNGVSPPRVISNDSKLKSFKRIFSRKRSNSSLSGLSDVFSRGGFRATSGPRLGHSTNGKSLQNVNIPFSQWDTTLVADWFALIGLGMYVNECRRWCKNGEHLMRATSADVEKELAIRNPLHRKKLRLAVAAMNDDEDELLKNAGKLDYLWIARWLDDIGLPQYKDAFIDARVDGRVLHYLAVEDLFYLKVTSQLHFASIRSGIRILRDNNYSNQCLKRRAAPEEANQTEWTYSEVSHWSSHRVMEWLRSIDLSEYAPNLRGSGVHGALILFENAFNADLFSTLLSIPTSKTLLRRHILAKFKQLVGDDLSKIKLEYECQPNYTPMIPGSKVKALKKGHFTLRKKRSDFELSEYVCPMTPTKSTRSAFISLVKRNYSPNPIEVTSSSATTNDAEWRNSLLRQSSLPSTKPAPSPSLPQNQQFSTNSNNTSRLTESSSSDNSAS